MTADIRTAAQAEVEATAHFGPPDFSAPNDRTIKWATYVHGFAEGAVWAQARVTPTREQIAIALAKQKARDWDSMTGVMHIAAIHAEYFNADAILALLAGIAERESSG